MREHIRMVSENEEEAATANTRALIWSQELTGAQTSFNITWPPSRAITVKFSRPGRDLSKETKTDETEEDEGLGNELEDLRREAAEVRQTLADRKRELS